MRTHSLKTVNPYFTKIWTLDKLFEVRKNDRDFRVGDELILREFDPEKGYLGRAIRAKINYILDEHEGLKPGYVVMQIEVTRFNHLNSLNRMDEPHSIYQKFETVEQVWTKTSEKLNQNG